MRPNKYFNLIFIFLVITNSHSICAIDQRVLDISIYSEHSAVITHKLSIGNIKKQLDIKLLSHISPTYHRPMTYDAVALSDLLTLVNIKNNEVIEIHFFCKDGYVSKWDGKPSINELVVALNEHENPHLFNSMNEGKGSLNPEPFYFMTKNADDYKVWPWPSQVYKLAIYNREIRPLYYPRNAEDLAVVMRGYKAFSQYCISCHTINLEGGHIGPELNIPQNITEYHDVDYLRKFIKDASRFRAKSRMMSFTFLTDKQIDDILAYIRYMKEYKIYEGDDI